MPFIDSIRELYHGSPENAMKRIFFGAGTLAAMQIINDEAFSALVLVAVVIVAAVLFFDAVFKEVDRK